jgi:hypothetical protein
LAISDQLRTVPWWTCCIIALLLLHSAAHAANVIVGNHTLLANTANQLVTIQVSGGEQIAGEDFFGQIGDGGAFNGGSNTKPSLTNVDIINGTIFASNNNGAYGDPQGTNPPGSNAAHPLIWVDGTTTNAGTVAANGLFATLMIDTTGLNSGTFPLILTGVANTLGPFDTTLRDANGALYAATVAAAFGHHVDITQVSFLGAAVLFMVIGNLMGKIRPNWFVGVRTPWTLSSKKSWNKTHRLAGWLFMLMGALFAVVAFVHTTWTFVAVLVVDATCIVSLVVYSSLVYRGDPHRTSPAGTQPSAD